MKTHQVIIPVNVTPYPEKHETSAATILARHFKADVIFIAPKSHKTADFVIDNVFWELKSPTGKGKRNIQRNLQAALGQSQNIVFDSRRSKMHQNKIKRELEVQFFKTRKMKRLILITKTSEIVEFEK